MARILVSLFSVLALVLLVGACEAEPAAGQPGAPCVTRTGETTPLYCVCGFPCVDGICQEDPNISCEDALSLPEPDIVVDPADSAGPESDDDVEAGDAEPSADALSDDATDDAEVVDGE